ncbi:MAG: ETC complex I subunit [Pseudomonadota bacterium]
MAAIIYQPAKTATQSGRRKTRQWVLEMIPTSPRGPDNLMGWTTAGDCTNQVRVHFDSLEHAKAFAQRRGLDYHVKPAATRRVTPRSYSDRFRTP